MNINGLGAKIVAKKGKMTEIEIEGQKINVPQDFLPANIAPGEEISLYFTSAGDGILQEKKLAKVILEEILNGK